MSIILAALVAATAPQQDKASEACPATTFIFKKSPEATPKPQPKPKTATVQSLNVPKAAPKPKADDCLAPKPKTVKGS